MNVRKAGLGYVMTLPSIVGEVRVDRLHRSRDGLHGELTVSTALPGARTSTGYLFKGRQNLSSLTAQTTLVRHLAGKSAAALTVENDGMGKGEAVDWAEIVAEFCRQVLEAESVGQPLVSVGNRPARQAELYTMTPLLPSKRTTVVFGDGGVGKSYLAVAIAVSMQVGVDVISGFTPLSKGNVLYLDWETTEDEIDERIKAVAAGAGIPAPDILYRYGTGPLADDVEALAREIAANDVALVIVDSVGMALGGGGDYGDANESVIRLFTALRYLGTTVLALDHVSKAGAELERGAFKPYGSAYKVNLARSVWELRRSKDAEDGHVALYHRKSNGSRLERPIGLHYIHDEGSLRFGREDITASDLERALPLRTRIVNYLIENHSGTGKEIAEALDANVGSVNTCLTRDLAGKSRIHKQEGRWVLTANVVEFPGGPS